MTQPNQIKKNDDFKLVIVFRMEGHNSRAILLRVVGITVSFTMIVFKMFLLFVAKSP